MKGDPGYEALPSEKKSFKLRDEDIPESFDVREAWPACANISGRVRDQSNCGSCWAFGSTEAFNDRFCIATGDSTTLFSPEDTNDCCSGPDCGFSQGCNGGMPTGAWRWFTTAGVSSGGDYEDVGRGTSCKPYTLQSCAHHTEPPAGMVPCDSIPDYTTPLCTNTCGEAAYGTAYGADKHRASSAYMVLGQTHMQKDLMEHGSLTAAMMVFEDFEAYSSGVYQHIVGEKVGAHAIKIIGWGVENGSPYWLCVNSWNTAWGERGLFKILRGSNECGIETDVVAGEI
jgi:cathepsin B